MKKLTWLFAFFLAVQTSTTTAQQLPVQTGAHAGFTRIVTQIPRGSSWKVEKRGNLIAIVLEDHTTGFDVGNAYFRITRERVAEIESSNDRLILTLACPCNVSAFQVDPSYVAIDVASPEFDLPTPLVKEVQTLANKPANSDNMKQEPKIILLNLSELNTDSSTSSPKNDREPTIAGLQSGTNDQILNAMQQQLAREFGEAATRGILTPNAQSTTKADLPRQNSTELSSIPLIPLRPLNPFLAKNMQISSSINAVKSSNNATPKQPQPKPSCTLGNQLDVQNWGNVGKFQTQISQGRSGLFVEFDHIDSAMLTTLVRTYLYFGFGQEAQQILNFDSTVASKSPHLLELSHIIDQMDSETTSLFSSLVECNNDAALWGLLSGTEIDPNSIINTPAALRTLNALPSHLRELLAPRLADRLKDFGNLDDAAASLRSIARLPKPQQPAELMAYAMQNLERGALGKGTQELAAIVLDNVMESPEALVTLVNTQAANDIGISESNIQLLNAYSKEFTGTDLGLRLAQAHVLGLITTDQFGVAKVKLSQLGVLDNLENGKDLKLELFDSIVQRAADAEFLEYVFAHSDQHAASLNNGTKLKLASRYLSLGFPERAQTILDKMPLNPSSSEQRLLSAQVALAMSLPFQAQANLLNETGIQADLIRGEAMSQLGQHAQAADIFRSVQADTRADAAAWLASEWQEIIRPAAQTFGPIQEMAAREQQPIDGLEPLSKTQAVVEESTVARRTIETLLLSLELQIP